MPAGTAARRTDSGIFLTDTSTMSSGNSAIWSSWNAQYTITGCTASSSTDGSLVWNSWNRDYGTGTCGTNTVTVQPWITNTNIEANAMIGASIWTAWNRGFVNTPARVLGFPAIHRELTDEEKAARAAEDERRRIEYEAQQAEKKTANDNAKKLLLSILNEEQKRDWAAHGHFYLHVEDRKYRIKRGRSGNVELVDPQTNAPLERLCAHPSQAVPDEDTAVAQMMHLLYDERRFIGLANSHWTAPGREPLKRRMAA